MSEKTDNIADTGGFEFVLTKSPMAGKVEEKKVEPKAIVKPVEQQRPVQPVAQPVAQPGFEHVANIPKLFCADREIAKGLLVDLFAMIGTLNAIELGTVNVETLPLVLQNAQRILTNLSDVMIRDCGVTDADLEDVLNVFKEVNEEATQKITQESKPEQKKEQTPDPKKVTPGVNIL